MKDTQFEQGLDRDGHSDTYLRAVARIEAGKREAERRRYATMAVAASVGAGAYGTGTMARVTTAAKLFCITFAFAAPSVLMILYVL